MEQSAHLVIGLGLVGVRVVRVRAGVSGQGQGRRAHRLSSRSAMALRMWAPEVRSRWKCTHLPRMGLQSERTVEGKRRHNK